MRRRDVLAGVASVGALAGAGALAVGGVPSIGEDEGERRHDPVEIETIDAPGSEAGTQLVPAPDQVTFVDLWATSCSICPSQMPVLAEAYDRVGDDVAFLSITNEREEQADDEEVVDWWEDHGGRWTVGRDQASELIVHYPAGTPYGILFDADGRVRWEEGGRKTSDEIVEQIEAVR